MTQTARHRDIRTVPTREGRQLSCLDRYLMLWIFSAMGLGILVEYSIPDAESVVDRFPLGITYIPTVIALIVMIHQPRAPAWHTR